MESMCHCGKPLHYQFESSREFVQKLIDRLGEFIPVVGPDGRRWKVQRHYIALHGIRGDKLHTYGFEELKPGN